MKELEELITCYFEMNDGEHIKNFQNEITLFAEDITIKITNRVLKHIIEQRKKDTYTLSDIQSFFVDVVRVLKDRRYKIIKNRDLDSRSFLLVETVFDKTVGVVLVLEILIAKDNSFFIKTGFYRAVSKIKKLLYQK